MKYIYKILSFLLVLLTFSCKNSLDVEIPIGSNTTEKVFSNFQSANNAMRGIYEGMSGGLVFGAVPYQYNLTINLGLSADELTKQSYSVAAQELLENNLLPTNTDTKRFWDKFYNYIFQSNLLIEGVTNSVGLTEVEKQMLIAEASFLRALNYFYLVNLFGNIPLTVKSDYLINRSLSQVGPQEVYTQMIADLKYAQSNLGNGNTVVGSRLRASKWAATALLARVYLYQKDWVNAEKEATAVIAQNTLYKNETLDKVFLANSTEVIFALDNASQTIYTQEAGNVTGNSLTNSACHLTPYLISQFVPGDQRGIKWVRVSSGTPASTSAPFKFKLFVTSPVGTKETVTPLRLAEQYLIRAEARAMLNNLDDAIEDLDVIRIRAGATADNTQAFQTVKFSSPSISKPDLIDAIYKERMLELFAELGHRWFDAKRSGKNLSDFFENRKPGIEESDAYYPIPAEEMQRNQKLKQNEGYF